MIIHVKLNMFNILQSDFWVLLLYSWDHVEICSYGTDWKFWDDM